MYISYYQCFLFVGPWHIQALLEGKKLLLKCHGKLSVVIQTGECQTRRKKGSCMSSEGRWSEPKLTRFSSMRCLFDFGRFNKCAVVCWRALRNTAGCFRALRFLTFDMFKKCYTNVARIHLKIHVTGMRGTIWFQMTHRRAKGQTSLYVWTPQWQKAKHPTYCTFIDALKRCGLDCRANTPNGCTGAGAESGDSNMMSHHE